MKIGVVGNSYYERRRKIKEFIFKLKQKGNIEIIGGGLRLGADRYIKKYTLEFDLPYSEFPPRHYCYNQYCVLESFKYGKKFNHWDYNERHIEIVKYCDKVVVFQEEHNHPEQTKYIISHTKRLDKDLVVIG
jgi:hypothetical protein